MFGWFRTNSSLRRQLREALAENAQLQQRAETAELASWIRRRRPDPHVVYVCPTTLPAAAEPTEQIRRTR